jgi:dsRNA-specific ribonuclease
MKSKKKDPARRKEQEQAWIGDTILDLFARKWILEHHGTVCGEQLRRMTSNQFLACFGNPTSVEAKIGRIYLDSGEEEAFAWIEAELLPLYLRQEKKEKRK